ncbi:MAG: enoyl-CoA hydratase/isomerase family protein [Pyrinomonadaceae bacterium]
MSNELETESIDDCLVVRFTRPEIRNPLSVTVLDQLNQIVDRCASDNKIATVIFTGTGKSFASGANLREIAAIATVDAPEFARRGQRLMAKIESLPQNTVAAINGFCFGGALDLALACNLRLASPDAQFAHPGTGLGIITGWGGTQRLPRLIGQTNALEMFFSAETIPADRAVSIGLVDEISNVPVERAIELAGATDVG